jgi:hypothetical protein
MPDYTMTDVFRRGLARLEALCPDSHLSFTSAWADVLRRSFDPNDPDLMELFDALKEAIEEVSE